MKSSHRWAVGLALLAVMLVMGVQQPVLAAELAVYEEQTQDPPFRLPFNIEPGPDSWYIVQFYGNTRGAYLRRNIWYGAGQGLHFGVDFAAPCGTEVVAIGDGEVAKVDAKEHGAGPHNLVIAHPNGLVSLYGHLLQPPNLYVGQPVQKGEVIGLTGDPDISCTSRPHLHLEVRNGGYWIAYNPVPLIDADWDSLALFGPSSGFQRDLQNPRRWLTLEDQPDVSFGAPLLNDYSEPWPPQW
ncbi:MAG: M23 family metallopeptidase [Chloroflexi bacterium]|nr:M23 family metallopeptidase [Chloroflexota bacterium]